MAATAAFVATISKTVRAARAISVQKRPASPGVFVGAPLRAAPNDQGFFTLDWGHATSDSRFYTFATDCRRWFTFSLPHDSMAYIGKAGGTGWGWPLPPWS